MRILGRCCEQSCTLRAEARRISNILLVTASHNTTFIKTHRSPDTKTGIGSIGSTSRLHGSLNQLLVRNGQFVY